MIVAIFMLALAVGPAPDCAYDKAAMLAMDSQAFDQDPKGGWRRLGAVKGCEAATADLILAYRTTNADRLAAERRGGATTLHWHEAQLRAVAGQTDAALALFKTYPSTTTDMQAYADATVALLEHDRPALLAARDRLVSASKPAYFDAMATDFKARTGRTMSWPPNLDVVDGFIACFDKPYLEAYGSSCRPATP